MTISTKMNFMCVVLFTLVNVTWAEDNFTKTTTEQVVSCNYTDKASKTLEKVVTETRDCMLRYFSIEDIKTRVEVGRNNDVLDIVSEEFCLVKSIIQRCVNHSLPMEDPCFSNNEQASRRLLLDITKSVLNFVCYEYGSRILLFLANGGFECVESKTSELEKCANETIGDSNLTDLTCENFYHRINNVTICEPYNKMQGCVIDVLKTCSEATPANIANSLFEHIKSFTACETLTNHTTVQLLIHEIP